MTRRETNAISSAYFDLNSPASFAGANRVYEAVKNKGINYDQVKKYLEGQSTYTLYRPTRKRYERLATVPSGLHTDWQCDLAVMDSLYKNNDRYKYMLVCIDVLSRQMFVAPIKTKSPKHVKEGFILKYLRRQKFYR